MNNKDQHFLVDKSIIRFIDEQSEFVREKNCVEIGGGKGAITSVLAKKCTLSVIEKDETLLDDLKKVFTGTIILGDVLKRDLSSYECVVSNVPYSISEPLFKKFVRHPQEMLLLVGKRLYDAILEKSKLGYVISSLWNVALVCDVPRYCFSPMPKVSSSLLRFRVKEQSEKEIIISELFVQFDKKTRNAVRNYFVSKGLPKKEATLLAKDFTTKRVDMLLTDEFRDVCAAVFVMSTSL